MIFLCLLVFIVLYLFFHCRGVLPGMRGTILAALLIGLYFCGFSQRETLAGAVLSAFLTVFFCESVLLFVAWDVVYGLVSLFRRRTNRRLRIGGNRVAMSLGLLMTIAFFALGIPQNQDYRIREQVVRLPSAARPFSAVFFSDLHMDPLFQREKLLRFAADLDSISPDFVLFGGDLADVDDKTLRAKGYDSLFRKISGAAKVGAFGIVGNHEAIMEKSGSRPGAWMRENGMTVLEDSTVCTEWVCITGRVDFQVARLRGKERLPLSEMLPPDSLPWILLDHQPKGVESGYEGRLPTLGLSGHTHNGQFFPATEFIGFFWRLAVGYGILDGVPWLVSAGIDSWGPPVRVGSEPDFWVIRFESSK